MFEECIFSYCISEKEVSFGELPKKYVFGKFAVNADNRTPYSAYEADGRECAVFGYAVDVRDGNREGLPEHILRNSQSITDVVEYERNLGGKYLILYADKTGTYALGDATTSIPLYYSNGNLTSNPEYFCREFGYTPDKTLQSVRDSGNISQAMPFDVTPYKEIKQVIPNHYYFFEENKAVRFANSLTKQKKLSVSEATEIAMPMIQNVANMYMSEFDIYCPITSGRDSRVVLAFLQASGTSPVKSYTIKHNNHTGKEQDLTVPVELAKVSPMLYEQICDVEVPESVRNDADVLFGKNKYSVRTLEIAYTIKSRYGKAAIINGDIIGQVGKCSLHRDIPSFLATPGYFRCKLHNYSDEAKKLLGEWLEEIKSSKEKVNTFDLFSIESRMGRWAGKENLIYNSLGQVYLNIFNSRSIIYTWTAVARGERKDSKLHVSLIEKKQPDLLKVPFSKSNSRVVRLSKSNGLFYYLSSYAKFYMERKKFRNGVK